MEMETLDFDSSLSVDFYLEGKTQIIPHTKKQESFIIPDRRLGELAARIILISIIFCFLTIFMEFPALHFGETYIQRNGVWKKVTKPIIHVPFGFKGKHI